MVSIRYCHHSQKCKLMQINSTFEVLHIRHNRKIDSLCYNATNNKNAFQSKATSPPPMENQTLSIWPEWHWPWGDLDLVYGLSLIDSLDR